jgi:hypothetical protein
MLVVVQLTGQVFGAGGRRQPSGVVLRIGGRSWRTPHQQKAGTDNGKRYQRPLEGNLNGAGNKPVPPVTCMDVV